MARAQTTKQTPGYQGIYSHTSTRTYIHTYTHTPPARTHTRTCKIAYTHTSHIHTYTYTRMHGCILTDTDTSTHNSLHTRTYIHTCTYMYIHPSIHTYIHTLIYIIIYIHTDRHRDTDTGMHDSLLAVYKFQVIDPVVSAATRSCCHHLNEKLLIIHTNAHTIPYLTMHTYIHM